MRIDDKCYVYGVIPATEGLEEKPAIGFIAHMDTAPDFSGENVNPQIIPEYDGGDVKLGDSEYALTLKDFPTSGIFKKEEPRSPPTEAPFLVQMTRLVWLRS